MHFFVSCLLFMHTVSLYFFSFTMKHVFSLVVFSVTFVSFQLCIDLKDVTDITKQKTARLFSNAIALSTAEKEVCAPIVLQKFTVINTIIIHSFFCSTSSLHLFTERMLTECYRSYGNTIKEAWLANTIWLQYYIHAYFNIYIHTYTETQ